MKTATLALMRCPLCRGDLVPVSQAADGVLRNGSVRCECREYPIVDGILLLDPARPLAHILASLKHGDITGALTLALGLPRGLALKLAERVWPAMPGRLLEALPGANPRRMLRGLSPNRDGPTYWDLELPYDAIQREYMRQRFATDSFLATYSLLPLAAARRGPLLDLGCGAGHYSFLLGLQGPRAAHLCADAEPLALLVAKRFFVPNAAFVHVNGDLPLPFRDGSFDTVFASDMLHYARAKATTGAELARVLAGDGLAILPHIHNADRPNPCPGTPLTVRGYRRVLDALRISVFPESLLVRRALSGERFDPDLQIDPAALEDCYAFTILAAHRPIAWSRSDAGQPTIPNGGVRLIVNPVYRTEAAGDTLLCRRRELSDYFLDEFPESRSYFSGELRLQRAELADRERRGELLARFLLVAVPPRFMPPRPEERWLTA